VVRVEHEILAVVAAIIDRDVHAIGVSSTLIQRSVDESLKRVVVSELAARARVEDDANRLLFAGRNPSERVVWARPAFRTTRDRAPRATAC